MLRYIQTQLFAPAPGAARDKTAQRKAGLDFALTLFQAARADDRASRLSDMRHALNFQLGLHARGPGRDSYKGVDEWKTPASVGAVPGVGRCRVPPGLRDS